MITEKHDDFDKVMGNNGYQMVLCANSHLFIYDRTQPMRKDTPTIEWNVVAAPFTADRLDVETAFNAGKIICKGIINANIIGNPSQSLYNATEHLLYHQTEIGQPYLYSFAEHAFKGERVQEGLTRTQKRVSYFKYYSDAGIRNETLDVHNGNDLIGNPLGLAHKARLMVSLGPAIASFFMALEVIGHKQLHRQMIGPLGSA